MPGVRIDRCLCEDKLFAMLLEVARKDGLELTELAEREGCGTHCGWCVAYLRRGMRTGEVVFSELLAKEPLETNKEWTGLQDFQD